MLIMEERNRREFLKLKKRHIKVIQSRKCLIFLYHDPWLYITKDISSSRTGTNFCTCFSLYFVEPDTKIVPFSVLLIILVTISQSDSGKLAIQELVTISPYLAPNIEIFKIKYRLFDVVKFHFLYDFTEIIFLFPKDKNHKVSSVHKFK